MMIFLRDDSKDFSHSLDDVWMVKQTDSNKCGDLLFHLKTNILCKYPFAERSSDHSVFPVAEYPQSQCRSPDLSIMHNHVPVRAA